MEQVIAGIFEKSLVGGAFLYLLYMFIAKFSVSQEMIVKTLGEISQTLSTLDERVKKLEGEKK
jgi:hypothetical protein